MTDDGRADDGARPQDARPKPCERCKQTGASLVWLWRSKKFLCPVCAVNEAYDDAVKVVIEEIQAQQRGGGPFTLMYEHPATVLQRVGHKIQEQQREQLEGAPTKAPPVVR